MKINKRVLFVIFLIIIIIFVILIFSKKENNVEKEKVDDFEIDVNKEVVYVTSPNEFYTVVSCVRKYLVAAKEKNPDNLLQLLSDDYKKNNNINKNNVLEKIDTYDISNIFEPKKMYAKDISINQRKFYVYGTIKEDVYLAKGETKDYYIVVDLDYETNTFVVNFDEKISEKIIKQE